MIEAEIRTNVKRRLNSYKDMRDEYRQLMDELQQLEAVMDSPSGPNYDGMPKSPGVGNPVERMVIKHLELVDRYKAQLSKLAAAQLAIEEMIENLEPTERRLARFRYIDGLTWDDVCERMNYSWRQTHRIHGKMLDKLVAQEMEKADG